MTAQTSQTPTRLDPNDVLPPTKLSGRAKLATVTDIGNELARIYRLTKCGALDASVATKLTYILATLAKLKTDAEFEARIKILERRAVS